MGLLSAALLAELQRPNPQVWPVLTIAFPNGTKLYSHADVNVAGTGTYDGKVERWGTWTRAASDRDGNLQTPVLTVRIADKDRTLANIVEGGNARGSAATVMLVSPNVPASSWTVIFTGLVAGERMQDLSWDLTFQYRDTPLRSYVPKVAITISDWPNAQPSLYGTYAPILYGVHDASAYSGFMYGQLPTYLVDQSTGTPEYLVAQGRILTVLRVYFNNAVASTSTYNIGHPVKNGRIYTTVQFASAPPTVTQPVTVDAYGYATNADGTGVLLRGPLSLQHFLDNFVFGDYQSGEWITPGANTDFVAFNNAQQWAEENKTKHVARYIGGPQQSRAMDEVAASLRASQVYVYWTFDGKLGCLPFDVRDTTYAYDAPQHASDVLGDILSPPEVMYDHKAVRDRVDAQYVYSQSQSRYFARMQVRDYSVTEEAPDSLQMAWGLAGTSDLTAVTVIPALITREIASLRLNRFRCPLMSVAADVPLWALDREMLDGFSWTHRLGPSTVGAGPGWGQEKWERRSTRILSIAVDLDRARVHLQTYDRRFVDTAFWDTMLTQWATNEEAQGVAAIRNGGWPYFIHSTTAWVVSPSTDGTVKEITPNRQVITDGGTLSEPSASNKVTQGQFIAGTSVGWVLTGLPGSVTNDATDLLWDSTITAVSAKFVATTSGRVQLAQTSAVVGSNMVTFGGRFSMSYKGPSLFYDLQRSSDALWFRDTDGTWQAAQQFNVVTSSTSDISRFISTKVVLMASSSETLSVVIGVNAGTTGHVYDVQVEDLPYATSRIRTNGAEVTRANSAFVYEDFSTLRMTLWPSERGTAGFEFVPDWDDADISIYRTKTLVMLSQLGKVQVASSGFSDGYRFEYSAATTTSPRTVNFVARSLGVDVLAIGTTGTLVHGTRYRVVGRWTSTDGEYGLPVRTMSIFIGTTSSTIFVKGTDIVRTADPIPAEYGWLGVGASLVSAPSTVGLTMWVKSDKNVYSDSGVTPAVDGGLVRQWNDQTTSANNLIQATSGNRPTYKTVFAVPTFPVLRFDPTATARMATAANLGTMLGANGTGHIFMVVASSSWVDGSPLFMDANRVAGLASASTTAYYLAGIRAFNTQGGVLATAFQGMAAGLFGLPLHGIEWIHTAATSGASVKASTDGLVSAGTTSGATDATGVATLGYRSDTSGYLTGDVCEILVYNAEQTGATLSQIQEYLQHKYGFSMSALQTSSSGGALAPSNNPLPGINNEDNCAGIISRVRITPHVLADDELVRLFIP